MKKIITIILAIMLNLSILSNSFAYDLNQNEKIGLDKVVSKIENLISKKWESYRNILVEKIKKIDSSKSDKLKAYVDYIVLALNKGLIHEIHKIELLNDTVSLNLKTWKTEDFYEWYAKYIKNKYPEDYEKSSFDYETAQLDYIKKNDFHLWIEVPEPEIKVLIWSSYKYVDIDFNSINKDNIKNLIFENEWRNIIREEVNYNFINKPFVLKTNDWYFFKIIISDFKKWRKNLSDWKYMSDNSMILEYQEIK